MYKTYDKIDESEELLVSAKAKRRSLLADKITGDNIYKALIFFDKLYDKMNEAEKREFLSQLVDNVQIYEERKENGQWLKSIEFKGRKYIGTPLKYYFEDVGLRNARLGFRQVEETHLMENIIYNELRVRGYQVDVGVVVKRERTDEGVQEKKQLEIDFVANMGSKRYYIQSAFSLTDAEKRALEKASLINVNDSYKKIIIVKDVVKPLHDNDGILTMSIYDFLLNEHSLEL